MGWVGLQQTKIFLMNVLTYSKLNSKSKLVSKLVFMKTKYYFNNLENKCLPNYFNSFTKIVVENKLKLLSSIMK